MRSLGRWLRRREELFAGIMFIAGAALPLWFVADSLRVGWIAIGRGGSARRLLTFDRDPIAVTAILTVAVVAAALFLWAGVVLTRRAWRTRRG